MYERRYGHSGQNYRQRAVTGRVQYGHQVPALIGGGNGRIIASPGLLFETRKGHAKALLRAIICALTSGQSQPIPAGRYRLCHARFQQRNHLVTIALRVQLLRRAFERGHRSCRDHHLAALGRRSRIGQRNVLSIKLGPPELECG